MLTAKRTVVELCGLPGSGKSTLAEALTAVLGTAGVEVAILDRPISAQVPRRARAVRRLAGAARAAGRHPVTSAGAARWFAGGRQSAADAAAAWVQWQALQQLIHAARRGPGVQLLEEGFVQTMWTALLRADRPQPPGSAWCLVPRSLRSDVVLLVDAPVETALERLALRSSRHSRTQRLASEDQRTELVHGETLLERLLVDCPVPVVRVVSDGRTAEQTALSAVGPLVDLVTAGAPRPH